MLIVITDGDDNSSRSTLDDAIAAALQSETIVFVVNSIPNHPERDHFLKKLAEYERILGDNKTVLLLSSNRDIFDALFKPPAPATSSPLPRPENGRITSTKPDKGGP